MAGRKKRKRKLIRTPRRTIQMTEAEHHGALLNAAADAVDKAREKVDQATATLVRAWNRLRDVEASAARLGSRVERDRKRAKTVKGMFRGEGDAL